MRLFGDGSEGEWFETYAHKHGVWPSMTYFELAERHLKAEKESGDHVGHRIRLFFVNVLVDVEEAQRETEQDDHVDVGEHADVTPDHLDDHDPERSEALAEAEEEEAMPPDERYG